MDTARAPSKATIFTEQSVKTYLLPPEGEQCEHLRFDAAGLAIHAELDPGQIQFEGSESVNHVTEDRTLRGNLPETSLCSP